MNKKNKNKTTFFENLSIILISIGTILCISSSFMEEEKAHTVITISLIFIFGSIYHFYHFLAKLDEHKQLYGSLIIGFVISLVIYSSFHIFSHVQILEDLSVSFRFNLLRGGNLKKESQSDAGNLEYIKYTPPKKARKDIQIIGIGTPTIEKVSGQWPLPWETYAKIVNHFNETNNILFFDIFFLDYKDQTYILKESFSKFSNNIILDYPIEASFESKKDILNLSIRQDELRKYKLVNVIDPDNDGISWMKLANPPIEPLSQNITGLGFANIRKDDTGVNRKMPLVAKLYNHGPNKETEYFPSIDLIAVCKYYGVDVVKDTEVYMGNYIKIKNIPKKELTTFNPQTLKEEVNDIMTRPNPEREIKIPIDLYGEMEINFPGGRYSYKAYELYDVANDWDKDTAGQFSDTIFLVAMYYATGVAQDVHGSPFGDMSGIEHHAHAINTILNQDFLHELPMYGILGIYLAVGLFISGVQHRLSTVFAIVLFISFFILYSFLSLFTFNEFLLVLPLPSVILEQLLIFVFIIVFKIFTEEQNTKYIKNTFSKFVSKDVVDELLKHPDQIALGGSKKEITVFFSDIRGFTTFSEVLTPEELVSLLNDYLSAMTDIIISYKGTIDKYMGDAIMAFWGAPLELEDHAYYACVSAIAQMEELVKLQAKYKGKNLPAINIGIGLNTGYAVVGNMGSSQRMDYTCMGDTVNLGSRLEGSNKMYSTNIIISEFTYEKVKDKVYVRELDLVKVKGKNLPVRIYELLGLVNEEDKHKIKQRHITSANIKTE